ncbi:MAG: PhnD/SsuA/transferrin family substrate-binding protein [Roseibium sp.]
MTGAILIIWMSIVGLVTVNAQGNKPLPDRLRLGVIVAAGEGARERIEPFRIALEDIVDLPVDLFLLPTMANAVEALSSGDIDYVRLSPSGYAATYQLCSCVVPLVTAAPDDFPARFYSILIGKREDKPLSLGNLKGGRLAVGAPQSVAGYRVPLANLFADGIDVRAHFATLVEVQNPVEGVRAVLDNRVQASLAWSSLAGEAQYGYTSGTLNDFYKSGARGFESLEIIWRSPPIPYSAHSVRKELPDALKRQLQAGLLDLRREDPAAFLAVEPDLHGGFEPVSHGDFRPVLRTYEKMFAPVLETEGR